MAKRRAQSPPARAAVIRVQRHHRNPSSDYAVFYDHTRSVSLVLEAYTVADHGDVLVLDMGEPVYILDLAKTLIRLSGKSEDEIEIEFIGLRPEEKLYEELFYSREQPVPTASRKVKRTQSTLMSWSVLRNHLTELSSLAAHGSEMSIREKVKEIIPDYQYACEIPPPPQPHARPLAAPRTAPNDAELSVGATAGS